MPENKGNLLGEKTKKKERGRKRKRSICPLSREAFTDLSPWCPVGCRTEGLGPEQQGTCVLRHFHKTGTLTSLYSQQKESQGNSCGLPWWRSGWESACQCGGHGFEPWSGKIPHAAEQLGPWATTTEPARLEPVLRNKRGRDGERPAHRDEEWPPLAAAREGPHAEGKT